MSFLGQLGTRAWFRCDGCGMDYYKDGTSVPSQTTCPVCLMEVEIEGGGEDESMEA